MRVPKAKPHRVPLLARPAVRHAFVASRRKPYGVTRFALSVNEARPEGWRPTAKIAGP